MQNWIKYKQEFFIALSAFLILSLAILSILNHQFKKEDQGFTKKFINKNYISVKLSALGLFTLTDTIYNLKINTKEVKTLLEKAQDPQQQDKIRQQLFTLLTPTYTNLNRLMIDEFQFYLPDGTSFLRFHTPKHYGDNLSDKRYSIRFVKKSKRPIRGFEVSKFSSGFRNLFPLFKNGQLIAIVEFAFSIDSLIDILSHLDDTKYMIMIKNSAIDAVGEKEAYQHYQQTLFSKNYSWDKTALEYMLSFHNQFSMQDFRTIEKLTKYAVIDKIDKKKNFLVDFIYKKKEFVNLFYQIKDIKGDDVAYIVVNKEENFFHQNRSHFQLLTLVALLFIFIISFLLFLYLKKQRDIKEMLEHKTYVDPLTNILNRRGFFEYSFPILNNLTQKKRFYSILFLDIDFFKKVNDTYGHDVGDLVIKQLANNLVNYFRSSDLVARWGGEEFVILLGGSDHHNAKQKAEEFRKRIEHLQIKDLPKITISIGVAQGKSQEELETIITKADEALYEAKQTGRNKVVVKE